MNGNKTDLFYNGTLGCGFSVAEIHENQALASWLFLHMTSDFKVAQLIHWCPISKIWVLLNSRDQNHPIWQKNSFWLIPKSLWIDRKLANQEKEGLLSAVGRWSKSSPILGPEGGHLYFRLDIIRVKGLAKHTLNTYFSGMKIAPKYAFLHAFFLIWVSCPFQNLSIWSKTYPFFQFCTFLHP